MTTVCQQEYIELAHQQMGGHKTLTDMKAREAILIGPTSRIITSLLTFLFGLSDEISLL